MYGKKFTEEEIEVLKNNPFTSTVSEPQIRFTVEFKRFLLEEREINETPWKEIFRKAGYDPEMLGTRRMQRASENIRKEALSAKGLHESSSKKHISKGNERVQTRKAIQQLQDEVLRLQQQIEFLKKTQILKVCVHLPVWLARDITDFYLRELPFQTGKHVILNHFIRF